MEIEPFGHHFWTFRFLGLFDLKMFFWGKNPKMTQKANNIGDKRPKNRPQSRPKMKKTMDVQVFLAGTDEESLGWIP